MKSTVVDESLSSYKPMYCSREYQTSTRSSEYAPEQQYQVRTDSNIQSVLPKETVNQNTTKHALLSDETATT